MTGVKAENAVTVGRFRATGERVLASMAGVSKGIEQAVTLALKSSVRIESDNVQVHPQLLFSQLIIAPMFWRIVLL